MKVNLMSGWIRALLPFALAIAACSVPGGLGHELQSATSVEPSPTTRPQSTSPATATLSRTPTSLTASPTWTSLPTLPPASALDRVERLMAGSPDCLLPCWWAITVGVTPWLEAEHLLATYSTEIRHWSTTTVEEPDGPHTLASYYVYYQTRDGDGGMAVGTRDGIVDYIFTNTDSTSRDMSAHDVVDKYGIPTLALVRTVDEVTQGGFPFWLAFFYDRNSFLVVYEFEAHRSGGDVVGCPATIPPKLHVWSAAEPWTMDKIQVAVLGVDPSTPLKDISEVSDYSLETLYAAFIAQGEDLCLRTPASVWE